MMAESSMVSFPSEEVLCRVPPSASNVTLRMISVNGLRMRFADTQMDEGGVFPSASSPASSVSLSSSSLSPSNRLPLVVFLHGWPESWFSWRHQLAECRRRGFRGVAPDMRGYGGTTPKHMAKVSD